MPDTTARRKRPHPGFANGRDPWTEEQNRVLRKHWQTGITSEAIGLMCGGRTKDAVRNQARRLGLGEKSVRGTRSDKGYRRDGTLMTEPRTKPEAANDGPTMRVDAPEKRETLAPTVGPMGLGAHTCCWPIGDPRSPSFGFCGRRATGEPRYCPEHLRVAFQPVQNTRGGYAKTRRV